jgi:hypothetical protein
VLPLWPFIVFDASSHAHRPTELDALLFAHLVLVRSVPLPINTLKTQLESLDNLVAYVDRIHSEYFA